MCVFAVERQRIRCVFEKVIEALKFNSRPWPEDLWANAVYSVLCNICPCALSMRAYVRACVHACVRFLQAFAYFSLR